jgi:membrane-associated phospholipid phosphatase
MDLKIVEWFQSLRSPFLDQIVLIITEFGDETVFLIIAALLFWTVNKKFAYRLVMFFLVNVAVNDILKNIIARPRPFLADPSLIDSVGVETYGYSMPSGHATNATGLALMLNEKFGSFKKWVTPLLITMAVLVALSRVYLGQHYLSDVVVAPIVVLLIYVILIKFVPKLTIRPQTLVYYAIPVLFVLLFFVQDKNFFVAVSAMIGTTLGYDLEQKYINYDVKAPFYTQVMKFLLGIIVALILKEGLKIILPYPSGDDINLLSLSLDFIRYFILTLWLTLGSMYIFKKIFKTKN